MREIKFRAKAKCIYNWSGYNKEKCVEEGEWVYGHYFTEPTNSEDKCTFDFVPHIRIPYGEHSADIEVDHKTVGQMFLVDGKEFYEGDKVRYWYVYADHSDACEMFGVEPQCNWPVHEVYADKREGVVSMVDGCLEVDGIPLSKIGAKFCGDLMGYHYHGIIEGGLREFVALANEMGLKSPMRENCKPVVVGNIHQTPELLGDS